MGNTEGTPQPGDSVETTRDASTEKNDRSSTGSDCPICKMATISSIERLLNRAFQQLNISFSTQVVVPIPGRWYHVDLLVTQKRIIVEADEDYHVRQRTQREHDRQRDADFTAAGYRVFRFTELDLVTDADACALRVMIEADLEPEDDPVITLGKPLSGRDNPAWTGGKPPWTCETCGGHFHAYKRGGQRPARTCSRECQVVWQRTTGASVKNRRSNGEKMKRLWANPEWRAAQTERIVSRRWPQ